MPISIGSTGGNPDAGGGVWTGPLVSPPGAEPGGELPSEPVATTDSSVGPAVTYTSSTPDRESGPYTALSIIRVRQGAFQAASLEPAVSAGGPAQEG